MARFLGKKKQEAVTSGMPLPPPKKLPPATKARPKPMPAKPVRQREPDYEEEEAYEPRKSSSPPLFIKIDKYRELVSEIQRLKSYALGLRDALDTLAEVEIELKQGMDIANKALDTFNSIITALDSKLLRVQGMEPEETGIPPEMEDYIKGVQEQIERIRQELKTISSA